MRRRGAKRTAIAIAVAIVLTGQHARADEASAPPEMVAPLHVLSPSTITTSTGASKSLPPGWFYSEAQRAALDAEIKRAQDAETRLGAENASLRASASEFTPSWRLMLGAVGLALLGGLAAGAALL